MLTKSVSLFLALLSTAFAQPQMIGFRQLQQYLPKGDVDGFRHGKLSGESSSMMGFSTSWAQADYVDSTNNSTASVKITDMVNLPSYMSMSPSITGDVDRETRTGYEKTVMYQGVRVLENFDTLSHQAKLQTLVARRFLIEITGTNMSGVRSLYAILDMTDFAGLEKLSPSQGGQGD